MLEVMVDFRKLPVRDKKGDVYVVVETPRGSAAKLEFDPDLQLFTLSKSLILGLSYPYDWGFIPSTEGEDGDPLDALILHDAATTPGLSSSAKSSACWKSCKPKVANAPYAMTVLSPSRAIRTANRPTTTRATCPSRFVPRSRNFSSRPTNWKTRS
jgi:hypothetical protein